MKKIFFFIFFVFIPFYSIFAQETNRIELLQKHIYTLASDSMRGRNAGSIENHQAAMYIENQFKEIGLQTFIDSTYFQPFLIFKDIKCQNVIGVIEGNDVELKNEYIVIGAHFDHIGCNFDNDSIMVYNGADDNASGTAALIELARSLKAKEGTFKRTILFVAFDAEEKGLYGSNFLSTQIPAEKVKLMISMDMIGYLKQSKKLYLKGVATIKDGRKTINNILLPNGLILDLDNFETSMIGSTDTDPFAKLKIPTLHVTTGLKSPYHKPEDDAEKIDYVGLSTVTEFMIHLTETFAKQETVYASGKISPKHGGTSFFEYGSLINVGTNSLLYSKSAFHSGKTGFAFASGLYTQFNFKHFSVRPEFLYENKTCYFPSTINYSSSPIRINVQSITLPLSFIVKADIESNLYLFLGLGGFYSYNFHAIKDGKRMTFSNEINHHAGGTQVSLGMNIYNINVSAVFRIGLSPAFINTPMVRNQSIYFNISYSL